MNLRLIREPSINLATLGVLFIDGHFACHVCEDVIRELAGVPVEQWKVKGSTAIPSGTYRVIVNHSQRFNRPLPLLEHVPGFTGVRIHPGNTVEDTEGCLLPGLDRQPGRVLRSRFAFEQVYERILDGIAGGGVSITIENPAA